MSEQERIFLKADKLLSTLANRRVVLYGLGGHTEYILKHLTDRSCIVGLMDAKRAGQTVFGLYVYSVEEAAANADVIVVVSRVAVERLIYERIKHLAEAGITIYNVSGDDLAVKYAVGSSSCEDNPYWNTTISDLKKAIDEHDVISFDIFDTLLMRRVIRPHEELGFEAELRLNVARRDMADCFNYAVEQGKELFITSDMYFSSEQLGNLLELNGISGYKEIIVSCEHNAAKENDGGLYEVLKRKSVGKSVLHIGDNKQADIENAITHEVDAFYIMSAYDMLLSSPMYRLLQDVPTLTDSRVIGEWVSNVLNSPFALNKKMGRAGIDDIQICAAYFAPIVIEFMKWLVCELKDYGEETIVLFLARDGYLIKWLYDWLKEEFGLALPESIYFPASRTAVSDKYTDKQENYINYARNAGVFNYKQILIYDLATKGTTAAKLSMIFGVPIQLLCFASFNIDEKFDINRTRSFLGDFSYYDLPYSFLHMYELLEIMSVPKQTQFLYIDDDLNPIYANGETENGKDWAGIAEFQDSICNYLKRYVNANPDWISEPICARTADNILNLLNSQFAVTSENVKNTFLFESPPEGIELTSWWDKIVN